MPAWLNIYTRKFLGEAQKLDEHITVFEHEGLIQNWHDRNIIAGTDWANELDQQFKTGDIILLSISPDFMASEYSWCKAQKTALSQNQQGNARVIPILLRETEWTVTALGQLQALPSGVRAVSLWDNQDQAFANI